MGLLDALFPNGGGGLLGGLPRDWQWQNTPSAGFQDASPAGPIFAGRPLDQIMGGMAPLASQQPTLAQQPLTPTEQQMMGITGGQPTIQQQPLTATERQMMGLTQPEAPPRQAAVSAPQAGPINTMDIGGYKMPQFGTVADYTPAAPVSTDISARAREPISPDATPAAFLAPPSTGGFGGAARGAMANMQGGPLGMIAGALGGAMGMGQGNPRDIERQNQIAQYQALIANGLTKQQAMLAILNPEAGKTLISEALTNREKYQKIGVDAFGGETYGFVNEHEHTINGKSMGAEGGNGGGAATGYLAPGVNAIDSSLTGKDYLDRHAAEFRVPRSRTHNDLWWANVIVAQEDVYLIDWENLGRGDYCRDLAFFRIMTYYERTVAPVSMWDGQPDDELLEAFYHPVLERYPEEFGDKTFWQRYGLYCLLEASLNFSRAYYGDRRGVKAAAHIIETGIRQFETYCLATEK